MSLRIERLFFKGSYDELLSQSFDIARATLQPSDLPWIVGALAFVGRIDEAVTLFLDRGSKCARELRIQMRFFLTLGHIRKSQYFEARRNCALSLREAQGSRSPKAIFYALQCVAFYRYYSGNYQKALRSSEGAERASIKCRCLFARSIASDLKGHLLVNLGEVGAGLRLLDQAKKLALKLKNRSLADAISISEAIYLAEFGFDFDEQIDRLEKTLATCKPTDTYSRANLLLELARQHLLRGNFSQAQDTLERAARSIYAAQNRRQEAKLNLRFASLALVRGEVTQGMSFVKAAHRCLDKSVDHVLELEALGLEIKVSVALGLRQSVPGLKERLHKLSKRFGGSINLRILQRLEARDDKEIRRARGQDPLGDLLDRIAREPDPRALVVRSGYFGLLPELVKVSPGQRMLLVGLNPGSLISVDPQGVYFSPQGFTPRLRRLLECLGAGPCSKEDLIRKIWGFRDYHSLRHDPVLYAAVTALRHVLGPRADWVRTTESGYAFLPGVRVESEISPADRTPVALPRMSLPRGELVATLSDSGLNLRQMKILELLESHGAIQPRLCKEIFKISEITASRDLSLLTRRGLLVRIGRGRAIEYVRKESL